MKKHYKIILIFIILLLVILFTLRATVYKLTDEDIEKIRVQFEKALLEDSEAQEELSYTPFKEYYEDFALCDDSLSKNIYVKVSTVHHNQFIKKGTVWFRYSKACEEIKETDILSEYLVEVEIEKKNGEWVAVHAFEYISSEAEPY